MAIKEISRRFDPHIAAEVVTFENSLGVRHVATIHVAGHENCPTCSRPLQKPGTPDVGGAIEQIKADLAKHEKLLTRHMRKRRR